MSPSRFRLRRVFAGPVRSTARLLARAGVRPDTVTYTTLLLSVIAFLVLTTTHVQWAYGTVVFIMGFMDGVDGSIARLTGRSTPHGAFMDSAIDKLTETIVLIAIPFAYRDTTLLGVPLDMWAMVCLAGWLLTSYFRARAESLGAHDLDVGPGARSERLFMLVVASVLGFLGHGLVVVTLVGVLTAGYRYWHYGREIREMEREERGAGTAGETHHHV